ncbi:MAG: hypothetical protein LH615_05070 [Ferruginibacter sp.]|nr:hypothetical protein [Ferruginibacter sp.]
MVLYAVMGMLCTHGYRYFLKKSDHFQKKGIRIWLSAFMATVVISTILSFVNFIPMVNKSPTMNFQVMENILDADKLLILAALGATIFSTITEDGGTGGDDMATLLLMTA